MITKKEDISEQTLALEMQQIAKRLNLQEAKEALYFPKYFQIETVRICNAHCPFCAIDQWDKSVPLMPEKLFDKIVEEMSHYADWIEFVAVQRAGEPMLDKKIVEHVRKFKDAGIKKVSMSTNASLLTREKARQLLEAGLDEIILSIDSVDKESYEKMRVGLKYETTIQNIRDFFEVRNQTRPKSIIRVRGVSFYDLSKPEHRAEVSRWEAFWSELKKPHDRIYMKRAHNWGNQKEWDGHSPHYGDIYHPCILPWSTMHVTSMGLVPLCPHDYDAEMNIGDINTQTIAEVWQNEKWKSIRELHGTGKRNEIKFCQGCRVFDVEFSMENWQQKQLYES